MITIFEQHNNIIKHVEYYNDVYDSINDRTVKLKDEVVKAIYYTLNGAYHNDKVAAYIHYNINGTLSLEYYYKHGELHREDGPAILYYDDGIVDAYISDYYLFDEKLNIEDYKRKIFEIEANKYNI